MTQIKPEGPYENCSIGKGKRVHIGYRMSNGKLNTLCPNSSWAEPQPLANKEADCSTCLREAAHA